HRRVETDPALAGPSRGRVLHPIAREDLELARIHDHRERDDERPLRGAEIALKAGVQAKRFRGLGERGERRAEELVPWAGHTGHLQRAHQESAFPTMIVGGSATYPSRSLIP